MKLGGEHIEAILEGMFKGLDGGDEYDRNTVYTYM